MPLLLAALASVIVSCGYADHSQPVPVRTDSDDVIVHSSEEIELDTEGLYPLPDLSGQQFQDVPRVAFDVFTIVNAAARAWSVIDSNRAIATAKHTYANAIPKGAGPFDMEGFSDMQFKSYRLSGKNKVGAVVYDLTYTLAHRYNGQVDGKGHFLENVTILPRNIKTLWGYTLDMGVLKTQVTNAGTKDAPIAQIVMELQVQVATAFKAQQIGKLYEFRGDSSTVKELKIPKADEESTVESI